MISKFKSLTSRTFESVKNFASDPIENLGFLIPMTMCLVSLISAIVGYIIFIVQGGYATQVSYIKESGTDGITQGFTTGTSSLLTSGNIAKAILILFLVQLVVMLVDYFKAAGKAKRIIMIIDLVVMGLIIVLSVAVFRLVVGTIVFTEEQLITALEPFMGVTINVKAILITYAVLAVVSLVSFIVLVAISECRWMAGYSILCLAFNFIVMPLTMLLLENIIPLVTGVVVLAIIAAVLYFIFKVLLSGDTEGGSSSSSGGSWFSNDNSNKKSTNNKGLSERGESKRKAGELVQEENCAYVPDLNGFGGFKLYKVNGFAHDYIESDNGIATRELCSIEDLRKGKFHIYESKTGREVKDHEIPWRKQN